MTQGNEYDKEITAILEHFRSPYRSDSPIESTVRLLEAKGKIKALLLKAKNDEKCERRRQHKSLCGCPMCTYHAEVYHLQQEEK